MVLDPEADQVQEAVQDRTLAVVPGQAVDPEAALAVARARIAKRVRALQMALELIPVTAQAPERILVQIRAWVAARARALALARIPRRVVVQGLIPVPGVGPARGQILQRAADLARVQIPVLAVALVRAQMQALVAAQAQAATRQRIQVAVRAREPTRPQTPAVVQRQVPTLVQVAVQAPIPQRTPRLATPVAQAVLVRGAIRHQVPIPIPDPIR